MKPWLESLCESVAYEVCNCCSASYCSLQWVHQYTLSVLSGISEWLTNNYVIIFLWFNNRLDTWEPFTCTCYVSKYLTYYILPHVAKCSAYFTRVIPPYAHQPSMILNTLVSIYVCSSYYMMTKYIPYCMCFCTQRTIGILFKSLGMWSASS